jgi:hypothetical protein
MCLKEAAPERASMSMTIRATGTKGQSELLRCGRRGKEGLGFLVTCRDLSSVEARLTEQSNTARSRGYYGKCLDRGAQGSGCSGCSCSSGELTEPRVRRG